jgi:hypothetical protein
VDREAAGLSEEIKNDAFSGPGLKQAFAGARAHLGEVDGAIDAVKNLLNLPGEASLTPAYLRLDPFWDSVRNDSRFQKICEERQP